MSSVVSGLGELRLQQQGPQERRTNQLLGAVAFGPAESAGPHALRTPGNRIQRTGPLTCRLIGGVFLTPAGALDGRDTASGLSYGLIRDRCLECRFSSE